MKNCKVNYIKKYGKDGTVYNQTLTINFDIAFNFNKYVNELKEETATHFYYTNEDLKILDYLETINFYNPTFTNLTTLTHFIEFYKKNYINGPQKNKFFERIKRRNTCFIVTSDK